MSSHPVTIQWQRLTKDFTYDTYSREHIWRFPNGETVNASAAPAYLGSDTCVDPEEAFVAALSSCHMLTFLAIAARKHYVMDRYEDQAVGYLDKNADGKIAMTRVELRPYVSLSGKRVPDADEIDAMHEKAHANCFIANSVRTEVIVLS